MTSQQFLHLFYLKTAAPPEYEQSGFDNRFDELLYAPPEGFSWGRYWHDLKYSASPAMQEAS